MSDTFFGTKFRGGQNFYLRWEVFPTRESALGLTGWTLSYPKLPSMAIPSCTYAALTMQKKYNLFTNVDSQPTPLRKKKVKYDENIGEQKH